MQVNVISEKLKELAENVITENGNLHRLLLIKILYVYSDEEKKSNKKIVFGSCEKVPDKYKFLIPYDFIIRVYQPNVNNFDKEQLKILLHHELLHIHFEEDKDGEIKFSCLPHDVEDFKTIIDKYGLNWAEPKMTLFEQKEA